VWVCWLKIAHYTGGFVFVWFFGLGCFIFVVCVWGDGLVHTVIMDAMLGCVGVVWGYVGVSISVSMGFLNLFPRVGAYP
jgi:hypothetical protein